MKTRSAFLAFILSAPAFAQSDSYQNPIDGKTYAAPGGWKNYKPEGETKPAASKVSLLGVRLLQNQTEMGSRTSPQALGDFIISAQNAASDVFALYHKPATLLVQFTCEPGKCLAKVAYHGDPPRDLLQAYQDKLERLQPLATSGEVKFQFTLQVQP